MGSKMQESSSSSRSRQAGHCFCPCCLLLILPILKADFVPKFSRSVTSSTRSFQESETILAQPDPTPRIRPRAASITAAFVEEGQ